MAHFKAFVNRGFSIVPCTLRLGYMAYTNRLQQNRNEFMRDTECYECNSDTVNYLDRIDQAFLGVDYAVCQLEET